MPPGLLTGMAPFEAVIKMTAGDYHEPFRARLLPPLAMVSDRGASVRARSRARFARPRDEVEGKLRRL